MADALQSTLYDGQRNITVTLADVSDGTGLSLATFLNAPALSPPPGAHIKCKRIRYSITNMIVTLYWAGTPNAILAMLGQGEDIIDWSKVYSAGLPNTATAATGSILITAVPFGSASAGFTITLEAIKAV